MNICKDCPGWNPQEGGEPAMQYRCLGCLREQYAPAVYGISTRGEACPWCGAKGITMSVQEYAKQLRKAQGYGTR